MTPGWHVPEHRGPFGCLIFFFLYRATRKKSSLTAEERVLGSAHQQGWLRPERKSFIGSGADCCGNVIAAHPAVTVAGEFLGCVGIQFEISAGIRRRKVSPCTALASRCVTQTFWACLTGQSSGGLTRKRQLRRRRNNGLMQAQPQMVPSYFTSAPQHATPSFVYASYLHELSVDFLVLFFFF